MKKKTHKVEKIENYRELLQRTISKYPNQIAYKYKKNVQDLEVCTVTYKQFGEDVKNFSTILLELGLENRKIAIIGNNRYEWCVSYLAVTTGNMIAVPLDKSLPINEIESLLKRSGAEAIIFDKKYEKELIDIRENTELQYLICMDLSEKNDVYNYKDLLEKGKELCNNGNRRYDQIKIDKNAVSIMLFTSGTTSQPKAVMLSQYNICSNIYAIASYVKMYKTDTLLSFLPIHHTFESTITFLYGIYYGVTVAFCDGLKYISQNLKEYNVTVLVAVPLVLENIYKKLQKGIEQSGKKKLINKMIKITRNFVQVKN